jgi:thiol reductant ABC exporter CydC subunit
VTPARERIWGAIEPHLGRFGLAALFQVATLASGAALLVTSALLLSKAALRPGLAALQLGIVGVRFFGLARPVLRYLERLASHDTTLRLSARLRAEFVQALVPLAPARLGSPRGGDLLSRMLSDVEALENAGVRALLPLASALVFVLLLAGVIPGPGPTLVLLFGLGSAGVLAPALSARLARRPSRLLLERRGPLEARLVDGVRGLADLVAFGQADAHAKAVQEESAALAVDQVRVARAAGVGTAVGALAADWTVVATVFVAVPLVAVERIRGEHLAGIALLSLAAFEAVMALPVAFASLGAARAGAERVVEVLELPPAVDEPEAPAPVGPGTRLEVRSLHFRHPGERRPALEDVSFVLEPGRLVAVVGPSGSGKSTLAHLLVRFWDAPPGTLFLDGTDVRSLRSDDVRARVGLLSQRFHVFGATLRQNLALARPGSTSRETEEAARFADLDAVAAELGQGWETFVGEQGARLSGGQRQRLALAQTFLLEAPLVAFDEPTAHLDRGAEAEILARIFDLARTRGVLLITHRLAALEGAAEILVLDQGRVRERGRFADLSRGAGFFARALRTEREGIAEVLSPGSPG